MDTNHSETLFHTEIMQGIYIISDPRSGPTEDGRSLAPGAATQNSYLVIGESRALLFDLALDDPSLKEYAEKLAAKPVQLVISHAHIDHIFNISSFDEVWMHPDDEPLLRDGAPWQAPTVPCPHVQHLNDGDTIDLGGRVLEVHHIPGHTDGSILLLDCKTGTLLSGDTVARRLLYGLHTFVPFEEFCKRLEALTALDFDVIYSAHDRCGLPKAHLEHMISVFKNKLPNDCETVELPGIGEVAVLTSGEEQKLHYFDIALPNSKLHGK